MDSGPSPLPSVYFFGVSVLETATACKCSVRPQWTTRSNLWMDGSADQTVLDCIGLYWKMSYARATYGQREQPARENECGVCTEVQKSESELCESGTASHPSKKRTG